MQAMGTVERPRSRREGQQEDTDTRGEDVELWACGDVGRECAGGVLITVTTIRRIVPALIVDADKLCIHTVMYTFVEVEIRITVPDIISLCYDARDILL